MKASDSLSEPFCLGERSKISQDIRKNGHVGAISPLKRVLLEDIKKQLHVNDALAKQYTTHLSQFEAKQPLPCGSLYESPLYDAVGLGSLDEARPAARCCFNSPLTCIEDHISILQ